jgi:hypothetical protein
MKDAELKLLAKGLVDLGNIVAGALVFGQFVAQQPFSLIEFIIGVFVTIAFYLGGVGFSKWSDQKKL